MQRKVFRVEQMFAGRRRMAPDAEPIGAHAPDAPRDDVTETDILERELVLLRDMIARNKQDLAILIGGQQDRRMVRAAGELGAAVDAMEQATQKILQATEIIDDSARSLASALTRKHEHGLAQDIQEHVVKIYEACNFQDLAGQRIGNVLKTLTMIEDQVVGMLERCNGVESSAGPSAKTDAKGAGLINGPKLDGDGGHADQAAIDAMFG